MFSPKQQAVIDRMTAELSRFPTAVIEELLRQRIEKDMQELRRQYPELFDDSGRPR